MNTTPTPSQTPSTVSSPKPVAAVQPPLSRPSSPKRKPSLLWQVLDHGGPGYLQFAITNICNAKCEFCSFAAGKLKKEELRRVTLEQAKMVIDVCERNHIGYLLFVGGEPLIHPDLPEMVSYAADRGIHPMICTNGSLWTEESVRDLIRRGLRSVITSIDSHDPAVHERHRGLPGVCKKIRRINTILREHGVQTTASVTISRLIQDYNKLIDFICDLGFDSLTFSYPLTTLGSSYLSFSSSDLITFTPEELIQHFETIKQLHRKSPIPIVNPRASLTDMQRHLRKEPERFGCLGGYKYFYLDWNLDLYRCHYWEKPMCKIWELDESKLIRDNCTRCMIDCYRDPSVLQFVAVRLHDAWQALRRGRLLTAARALLDRRILTSLQANWEARKYTRRV